MEHGTTRHRKNSTGEKYSAREPVLELYFLRAQKILRRKAVVVAAEKPTPEARDSSGIFFGALPDEMRRDAKGAEALLPRMNAGAPTERQRRRPEASGTNYKIQIPTEKQVNPVPLFANPAKDGASARAEINCDVIYLSAIIIANLE